MNHVKTVIEIDRNDLAAAVGSAREALSTVGDGARWQLEFSAQGEVRAARAFFLEAVQCDQARVAVEAFVRAVVARNTEKQEALEVGSEEQAGSLAVLALAGHSSDYLGLYAEFLGSIDLDHAHNHLEAVAELLKVHGTSAVAAQLSMVLRDGEMFADSYGWVGVECSTSDLGALQNALESGDLETVTSALERLPGFFDSQDAALSVLDAMCEALARFDTLGDKALLGPLQYLLEHGIHWGRGAHAIMWLSLRHGDHVRGLIEGLDGYGGVDAADMRDALRSALSESNVGNLFDARPPLRLWLQELAAWSPEQQLLDETEHALSVLGHDDSLAALRGASALLREVGGVALAKADYWLQVLPRRLCSNLAPTDVERVRAFVEVFALLRLGDGVHQKIATYDAPLVRALVDGAGSGVQALGAAFATALEETEPDLAPLAAALRDAHQA